MNETQQTQIVTTNHRTGPKNIPIETIIEHKQQGLTTREIGKLLDCDHSNIIRRLQRVSDQIDILPQYKRHRADILALKGREILSNITQDKLKTSSAYSLSLMYGILYDKERLERDQSTGNISLRIADIAALKRQDRDDPTPTNSTSVGDDNE